MTNIVVGLQSENTILAAPYGGGIEDAQSLGLVKGGVSIEHASELHEITVDQFLGPVDAVTTYESMKVRTTLAEATLKNLALAMGRGAGGADDVFEFGGGEENIYYTVFINVKGKGGRVRTYTFWKCRVAAKTVQAYKRDSETVADVEFIVLTDVTKPAGARFGKVEDR